MDKILQETVKPLRYKGSLDSVGAKVGMLVQFYFPHLNDDYNKYIQIFEETSFRTFELNEEESLSIEELTECSEAHRLFISKIVIEPKKYI